MRETCEIVMFDYDVVMRETCEIVMFDYGVVMRETCEIVMFDYDVPNKFLSWPQHNKTLKSHKFLS
jgi:hypothetical protein